MASESAGNQAVDSGGRVGPGDDTGREPQSRAGVTAAPAPGRTADTASLTVVDPIVLARLVTEAVARLRETAEVFVVRLRRDGDFDPAALDDLCEAVDRCGRRWRAADAVPKEAALVLAELYPVIQGCAWQYGETDPMRRQILDAAARVQESVGASLDNPGGGLDREL